MRAPPLICPACQHENPAEANFCQKCGAPFSTACPQCGTELPSAAKFCHECGRSTIEAQPDRDPRAYTPKHLAVLIAPVVTGSHPTRTQDLHTTELVRGG